MVWAASVGPPGNAWAIPEEGPRSPTGVEPHRDLEDCAAVRRGLLVIVVLACLAVPAGAHAWVASWETGMEGPYPFATLGPAQYAFPGDQAIDQTMRMIVHLSSGGTQVRVRMSNIVGEKPVTFDGLRVARRSAGPTIEAGTDRRLTFGGNPTLTIPAGGEAVSDPVDLETEAGEDLAVTFHVVGTSGPMTWHGTAFTVSYVSLPLSGDVGDDARGFTMDIPLQSWFFVAGVDVDGGPARSTVVGFGDSLTDGFLTAPDRNDRWTDLLVSRLGPRFSVVNAGISGNSISRARNSETDPYAGPPGVDRWDRDVLDRAGVRSAVLFEGTNDLSIDAPVTKIEEAILDVTARAHARGICVIGATITPRSDGLLPYSWNAGTMEPRRVSLNGWLRSATPGFDGLADLDLALRDPLNEKRLRPGYDAGDGVHFTTAGRQAVADTIPVDVIRRCAAAPATAPAACRKQVVLRLPAGLRHVAVRVRGRTQRVARGTRRLVLHPKSGRVVVHVRARRADGTRYQRERTVLIC